MAFPQLASARLYGILDTGYCAPSDMFRILGEMIRGGVDIVQVRAKGFSAPEILPWLPSLKALASEAGIPLIINDFPELGAQGHGVHVGQDDLPVASSRAALGGQGIVGKSTHSFAQAVAAAAEGADYIGFGPLFPTPTKAGRPAIGMDEISQVHAAVHIPIFCIGGIKRENLPEVIAAGARRVVIVSGILQSVDIPGYISDCKALLPEY